MSIPANIAEGQGRRHTREFVHYLGIASGSLAEAETHILIAQRLGYLDDQHCASLLARAAEVGRILNGLLASLEEKLAVPTSAH